jgi:hypothetical protein
MSVALPVFGYYAMAAGAVSHQMATSGVRRNMPDPRAIAFNFYTLVSIIEQSFQFSTY